MADINNPSGPEQPESNERKPDPAAEFINSLTEEQRRLFAEVLGAGDSSANKTATPGKAKEQVGEAQTRIKEKLLAILQANESNKGASVRADVNVNHLFGNLYDSLSDRREYLADKKNLKYKYPKFGFIAGPISRKKIQDIDTMLTHIGELDQTEYNDATRFTESEIKKMQRELDNATKSTADNEPEATPDDSGNGDGNEPPTSNSPSDTPDDDKRPPRMKRYLRWPWRRRRPNLRSPEGSNAPRQPVTPITPVSEVPTPPPVTPVVATETPDSAPEPEIKTDGGNNVGKGWPRAIAAGSLVPFVWLSKNGAAGGRFLLWDGPIKGKGSPIYLINIPSKVVQATGRSAKRGWSLLKGRKRNIALGAVAGSIVPGPGTVLGAISGAFWPKWKDKNSSSDTK